MHASMLHQSHRCQHPTQRAKQICAQQLPYPWQAAIDFQSGATYYYNEQTGQSQWEAPIAQRGNGALGLQGNGAPTQQGYGAPTQQGYGAQALVSVAPSRGMLSSPCTLRNGEEQAFGRYDTVEQSIYVSRLQCIVRVAPDGTATLVSVGKPATLVRLDSASPWFALTKRKGQIPKWILDQFGYDVWRQDRSPFVLNGGEQISLDQRNPEEAILTVTSQVQQGMGEGYGVPYTGGWTG
jgi:hypothetical protein